MTVATLDAVLNSYVGKEQDDLRAAVAATVRQLAQAAVKVRHTINQGVLGKAFAGTRGGFNADGDAQKDLDVYADDIFLDAMRHAPVALYASEELEQPVLLNKDAPICIAIDPLDGSSNIDTNVSIGTIFSLLPATGAPDGNPAATFLQPGEKQIGAGFFIYGPQLALVLSLGSGTHVFVQSTRLGTFVQAYESRIVPTRAHEFAINAANYRHWDEAVRLYVDDCLKGSEGPRERDFNMRWIASLVADCYRILMRGGVFLYPGDKRRGYGQGRLRLVYEANPIAYLIEQAGGAATDTIGRILEIEPNSLHQRVPVVFGSAKEVARITRYHTDPSSIGERSPLFGNRGLFRA
ncbi:MULTISPECIES: class 1 fructose-bisphosphatase [unclassified Mesorhizobium]|jgi:fructose-1,6-bisphosphatase I|uniref:class 1 fructose-bisphosphatase n=1 Tax=unclassified Mesorhizobium TaxID=325217 RepID=UPI0008F1B2A1|nr:MULTISPECIES: class 1 fructose-bisphosphatase [unclassified Mesorhizobium]RJG44256.1 class 1 fructose-bisphosphatase [Mesorhizobium sp. DCY119]SFU19820.1 D-fructose 1,6-bisphosphatase [Mesorhizobium sp. YR577]